MIARIERKLPHVRITFCNKAYGYKWFKNLRRQNKDHFSVLLAIMHEIKMKDGQDISTKDIFLRNPDVAYRVNVLNFNIIPKNKQEFGHNGKGIRHAKFAPSKSVAVIWEKIGRDIYITFDDHAPIRYHRAIYHLREIRLGNAVFPRRPRVTGRFLRRIKSFWKFRYLKSLHKFDPNDKYYE